MAFVSTDNSLITALISASKVLDVDGGVPGGVKEGFGRGEQLNGTDELAGEDLEASDFSVVDCKNIFETGAGLAVIAEVAERTSNLLDIGTLTSMRFLLESNLFSSVTSTRLSLTASSP